MYNLALKYLSPFVLLGIILAAAYFYYTNTQSRIESLASQNTTLSQQNLSYQSQIQRLSNDINRITNEQRLLQQRLQQSEKYYNELLATFRRHDFTNLVLQRPGLIERRVNDATKQVFEDLESITRND
jgi:septal ring factor EnvC (AmiA/AmiB activator)